MLDTYSLEESAKRTKAANKALFKAADTGHLSLYYNSLSRGADIHYTPDNKYTPLMAVVGKQPSTFFESLKSTFRDSSEMNSAYNTIAKELVTGGVDVDSRGPYGFTALHYAHFAKNYSAIELLLDNGADPTVMATSTGSPLRLTKDDPNARAIYKARGLI